MKLTRAKLMEFAIQINEEVFNFQINLNGLKFKNIKEDKENPNCRAWYYPDANRIVLIEKHHPNEFEIFHTIAHELIHVFNEQCDPDQELTHLNHGGKFFRYYKRKVCDTYGIKFNKEF